MNINEAEFEYDEEDPPGYQSGVAEIGKQAGGAEESVRLFELPPGQHLCPYHYEYVEEWALVIDGPVEYRGPQGVHTLTDGALVCFPSGPEGAHQLTNRGEAAARVLMWSSARMPAVAVYPDSDKIAVWPPNEADEVMLHRADGKASYYDGEPVDS
jgi:uncharacterized cupin superfamily protein